jgi:hypothetical protein
VRSIRLQIRALVAVTLARLVLKRWGTTSTLQRLGARGSGRVSADPHEALHAVRRAARLARANCLPQAVALTVLLRRDGYEPALILGCRKMHSGRWIAHAWVEVGADVLEPGVETGFTSLARLSASTGWVPSPIGSA